MSGAEGSLDKATLARGLALATQGLLNKIDAAEQKELNGIEIPPASLQKQLVRP